MTTPRSTRIARPASRLDTRAVEDYLKVVYGHTEWQPDPITPSQLAARLGLAPSSVTEMIKKLGVQGLVEHRPYGAVVLTDLGRAEAIRMVRRHRLIETWLVARMGYGWDEVHDEAEVLEHTVSDRLLAALDADLGHPSADPHGDPIPSEDGDPRRPDAIPFAALPSGAAARVARVSDRDPGVLRALADAGIGPGSEVAGGALGPEQAAAVWVVRPA